MTDCLNIRRPGEFTSVIRTVRTVKDGVITELTYHGGVLVRTKTWEAKA